MLTMRAVLATLALLATTDPAPAHAAPAADTAIATPDCPPVADPLAPLPTSPSPSPGSASQRPMPERGFLWRIVKGGHASWLFGTLHVGRRDWAFPGPKTAAALASSDTLALEIDPLDPSMQQRLAASLALDPMNPLLPTWPRPPLAPDVRQRIARLTARECVAPQALAAYAPEVQVAGLSSLLGRRNGLDPAYGIDDRLSAWARAAQPRRPVVSLESPEAQAALLRAANPAEAEAFVDNALADIESGHALQSLLQVAKVWADGDWAALQAYASWCDCMNTPADRAEMQRLLDDRNPAMAAAIDALHRRGHRVFAAVGSLHMIGPTGLPAALAARGYRVQRIDVGRRKQQETTP